MSIVEEKIIYKIEQKIIEAEISITSSNVESNDTQIYYEVSITSAKRDELTQIFNRLKDISLKISKEIKLDILWDDVGSYYASKSYPLINNIENLLRKLIAKFMLVKFGINWFSNQVHEEIVAKSSSDVDEDNDNLNDLHKTTFGQLSLVLFKKRSRIGNETLLSLLRELERNSRWSDEDKEQVLKRIPKSLWDEYFNTINEKNEKDFKIKWDILRKIRNDVSHNRVISKEKYKKLNGVSQLIEKVLIKAVDSIGAIEVKEADKDLIVEHIVTKTDMQQSNYWFFNTNETYSPGAYKKMFSENVLAVYGYSDNEMLKGTDVGNKILVYINEQGIRAVAEVIDPKVFAGEGIFIDDDGTQLPNEYHLKVKWDVKLSKEKAISYSEASEIGYSLPIRSTFCRLHRTNLAHTLYEQSLNRGKNEKQH